MSEARMTEAERQGVVNVVLHPAMFDAFVDWLDSRDADLSPPIPTGNEEAETFRVVMPRALGAPR